MKEKEEEFSNYSSKNILSRLETVKSEKMIELEDKLISSSSEYIPPSIRKDSQTSFDRALMNEVREEEQENYLKKKIKERERIKSQLNSMITKDYIVFFVIMVSTGLNFNYLYLPIVLISIIYFILIEKISYKLMKCRFFFEIFTVGYASYILLYKGLIYSLIISGNKSVLVDYKDYYIDFGICALKDVNSTYYLCLNFLPECNIIVVCVYAVIVSFRCRLLKNKDIISKKITSIKITKYILIIYIFFVQFTLLNLSYLSLFYMICIQTVMLLNSFKFHSRIMKKILKSVSIFLCFFICIQMVLINFLNIHSIQLAAEEYYKKLNSKGGFSIYFTWKQIGVNLSPSDDLSNIIDKYGGYFCGVVTLMLLKSTINKLKAEMFLELRTHHKKKNKTGKDNNKDKITKVKGIFTRIISNIMLFLSHPTFNFELTRMLSIAWTYFYRNIYSFGILIFIFLSFFSVHIKKSKGLVLFLLTPMLMFSLCSYHITNIKGICEFSKEEDKLNYRRLAISKYDNTTIEYWIGHVFFLIVMFLINSIYTAELNHKNKTIEKNGGLSVTYATLAEEDNHNRHKKAKYEEYDNDDEKKEIHIDEKESIEENPSSINDCDSSFLLQNYDDDIQQSMVIKSRIQKTIVDTILPKYYNSNKTDKDNNDEEQEEFSFSFLTLMVKGVFMHIDKITLFVMYLVSVYTVNAVHVILVFILIFQIIAPGILNGCYKIIILIFQLLYVIEFLIDLLKINFAKQFKSIKTLLQFFFVYSDDITSNDIEYFLYGVILCFYFQYRTSNIDSIKNILNHKGISVREYIKKKLKDRSKIQTLLLIMGNIGLHFYLWSLIFLFIFFNSYFEINLIFGIKLIVFLISCFQFIYLSHSLSKDSNTNILIMSNRILIFLCCLNTLLVYLYQFLCKDFLQLKDKIKNNESSFFVKNLPNIGFTIYEEQNLYYNFIPHFMTTFISVLFIWQSEEIIQSMLIYLTRRRNTCGKKLQEEMKKKLAEKQRMERIKEEENEFIQDKMYADKYNENNVELKSKSKRLLTANIILFLTECYWLGLFLISGIIFSSYDLSFSMLINVLIFGILSIVMFFRIIFKLTKYISKKSYYISKVIRFSLVEKPRNREANKKFHAKIFKSLLFFSFLYLALVYFYGIFDLFQHGCNPELFKGCDNSHSEIFEVDKDDDTEHNNTEAKIKSVAFLFGIYFNIRKENLMKVVAAHLILTLLVIIDLYNQKLAEHYLNITDTLTKDIQKLVNDNNVLQKYSDVADLNILIQIGLSIAGINLNIKENGEDNSRVSLMDKFYSPLDKSKKNDNNNLEEIKEKENGDEDEPLKRDEPKSATSQCFDLNEKDQSNEFLHNIKVQKVIDIIKRSNDNEQQLSLSNSKDRIIRFIKQLIEELIIFISLCIALSKLNIYTFIYFIVSIVLIKTKKSMFQIYLLYIFIFLGIIIQSLFFILNTNINTSPRTEDELIFDVLNKTMNIPMYKLHYNLTDNQGFFYGLGTNKSQIKLIWLEYMQIIIIYFYLNYFSYSIYQDIINLGSTFLSEQKFDFETLNMNQGSIEQIKTMTEFQFYELRECLKCFNFNIGNTITDFFQTLKINRDAYFTNYFGTDDKKSSNLNLSQVKNPILKQLIEVRMYEKEYLNTMEKREKGKYKPLPSYILIIQEILYLYFHCFLLILIIMLSMMTAGILSAIYFTICFYYLLKSDSIFLGIEYTYPKAIKITLRFLVIVDILIQGIYQIPYFHMRGETVFNAFGFIKIENINAIQQLEIFGKVLIYFLMSIQNLIYKSKNFKRYYLVYLLENKFQTNKTSLVNAFTFNNDRVKIYEESLEARLKSVEIMDDFKQIIDDLKTELKKMGERSYGKYISTEKKSPLEFINEKNKSNDNNIIIDRINGNKENQNVTKTYLKVEEIKEKIKSKLFDKFIIKVYLWLHNNSANYKNIDKEALNDFYIETIKGETKIKSIIETDVNTYLSIVDLTRLEKSDMKDIELLIESQFNEEKKKVLETKKREEAKSKKNISKFKKFGNNLLRLNRFAKMVYGQFNAGLFYDTNIKTKEGIDIIELFKIQTEKERKEKEKKEKEIEIKKQKLKYIEALFDTKLFKKHLKTSYLIKHIFLYLRSICINNFTWFCYIIMILNHMSSGSIITLVYPMSIFCYALLEYPRPKKSYWGFCLIYTMIIMVIKFIIQLKIIILIIPEERYIEKYHHFITKLYYYKIGFKYFKSTFSQEFLRYISFDGLLILSILINRNLLLTEGLWDKREEEIENIYEASERISIYGTKKYSNKFEAMQDLLLKYIYTPREVINIKRNMAKNKEAKDCMKKSQKYKKLIKHKFPFFGKRNINPEYNEANKNYFDRIFTKIRNEKPGKDFYASYSLVMFLICIYILFFFTEMDRDKTYGSLNLDTSQFSGIMVISLIFHICILAYDRVIFISQNRENIEYDYFFYKRNKINKQGELISDNEKNNLRNKIVENDKESKVNKISAKEIKNLKEKYNILFIQKEAFNKPLLNKYVLHIFTSIFSHLMIFFYFPIKGNSNLGIGLYCLEEDKTCNNFGSNKYIIIFYIIYIFYLFLSGLQVKYGFYDIKRKSLFKKKDDELYSNLCSLFKAIPFINEIKNAIDWTFTSTCFNLIQWNKFEAIYDTIFDTYCEKSDWDEKPVGEKISGKKRFAMGGSLAFLLIIILIAPLILFSSLNPTNKKNNLTGAKISVDLDFRYQNGAIKKYNIFENTRADSISDMNALDDSIWKKYNYSKSVQTRNFNKEQVQRVIFSNTSDINWGLAMPHIENLVELLYSANDSDISSIDLNIEYEFTRRLPAEAQTCSGSFVGSIFTKDDSNNSYANIEKIIEAFINCENINDIITIDNVYCPPLRLTSGTEVNEIEDEKLFKQRGVIMGFQGCVKDKYDDPDFSQSFFTLNSFSDDEEDEQPLELHVFNDKISETTYGYSVLTFYISFVLLAGSYIREFLANEPEKIMLEELPHPKRIVDLCEGIKMARYNYDFKTEEFLYTILIELLRSPDYLKIITDSSLDHFKLREEMNDDN